MSFKSKISYFQGYSADLSLKHNLHAILPCNLFLLQQYSFLRACPHYANVLKTILSTMAGTFTQDHLDGYILFAPVPMPIVLRAIPQSFFFLSFLSPTEFGLIRCQYLHCTYTTFYKHINQPYLIVWGNVCGIPADVADTLSKISRNQCNCDSNYTFLN